MKRYLVIGGEVPSMTDEDWCYVSPSRLCQLYGVSPSECIMASNDDDPRLRGLERSVFIVLKPDYEGRYELEP